MHVAFDIAQTAVERAGCAWYADSLARALARRPDVQVDLYPHFDAWINAGIDRATRVASARMMLAGSSTEEIRDTWRRTATDGLPGLPPIVHANSFQAPAIAGSRLVFTIHDLSFWSHPGLASEATRLHCQHGMLDALERAAGLVFVSDAAREEFEHILPRWLAQARRPWAIVPGASRFTPEPRNTSLRPDAPWICVGSIEPRKNHATLLDAHALYRRAVRHPRPLHLLGGRGWHSEALHDRLAAMPASEGVRYLGYVTEAELAENYRGAFALIQPSWHEGFGLPVVEAGSFGVPVICSDIPSLREVGGDAATFFPARSSEDLAADMIALHEDLALRDTRAQASADNAGRFSWDDSAARAVVFYASLRS